MNASRGGLLLACGESHAVGHPLWVTFPFDPDARGIQPEILARVVRSVDKAGDLASDAALCNVAVRFERPGRFSISGNGKERGIDKKNGAGRPLALPIRVRPEHIPWHEEAMTLEIAPGKLKFMTNREYSFGERLRVAFVTRGDAPWSGDQEWDAEVTGIEMAAESDSLLVTVRRKPS